jgi:hypothetical protein
LEISLEGDGQATQTLDLSSINTDTDDQTIDVLNLNGTSLEISLEGDGQATQSLDLSSINTVQAIVADADNDTKVQVEESGDEDKIRFDMGGTEYFTMSAGRLEVLNTGSSVFIGEGAGANDDLTDNRNVFIGYQAGQDNTTGIENTACGSYALNENTTGFNNTANGYLALSKNTTGHGNTANGNRALFKNTTGQQNTANGYQALNSNTDGTNNTANGYQALFSNTTGDNNTANGYSAFSDGTDYTNATGLGYDAEPGASNTVRIGNASVTAIGGYADWTNVSDARFKTNVDEKVVGLDFIKKLRPVTYNLDMDAIARFNNTPDSLRLPESEALKAAELQSGFIAQEVEQAANTLGYDFHGVDKPKNETSHYGLRYATFVVPLVKAVQEQQEIIEDYEARMSTMEQEATELKSRMEQEAAELKSSLTELLQRMEALESKKGN